MVIKELINFHLVVAANVPGKQQKILKDWAEQHSKLVVLKSCKPHTPIKDTIVTAMATPTMQLATRTAKPGKKTIKKIIKKIIKKKPARK